MKPDNPTHDRGKAARATGSRAELVELLGRGVATVADLAKQLRLTRNAVRFHLASLQRAGLVRPTGTRPGKRRAHTTYKLTKQADQRFPNAYKHSLREILAELKRRYTANTVIAILRSAGNRLAKGSSRGRRNVSVRNRASQAKRLLEALGGSIAIEPHSGMSLLRSDGCPLGAVVAAHPEVCNMVETFLARSTGASVRQQCHHGPNPRCQFQIRSSIYS